MGEVLNGSLLWRLVTRLHFVQSLQIVQYLANVREEQLKARVVPRQAEPFLLVT